VLAFRGVQSGQQCALAVQQVGQGRVHPLLAPVGQDDEHSPLVPRVGLAADEAGGGQPVDPVGHGARGHQRRAEQRAGGELERRSLPAQRREHVEFPRLKLVIGERPTARDVQVPSQPGDATEDLQRLDVQVRPLRPPGGHQVIHFIAQHWYREDPGSRIRLGAGTGALAHV
jgi:hypothetical protein